MPKKRKKSPSFHIQAPIIGNLPPTTSQKQGKKSIQNSIPINKHIELQQQKHFSSTLLFNDIIDIPIKPRTIGQHKLVNTIEDDSKSIVIVSGPAGTGKTLLSTLCAIRALKAGKIKKIIISRPTVAVDDKDIGFLPGNMMEKMMPWIKPFEDIFFDYFSRQEYKRLVESGVIEIAPLTYIRGRTFKDAYILIDEAQGTSPKSLLSVLTRIGENSKIIVTGDIMQTDFENKLNGLADILKRIFEKDKISKHIGVVILSKSDIQRHPVISDVLELYGISESSPEEVKDCNT